MAASEKIAKNGIAFLGSEVFSCKNNKNYFVKISVLVRGVINQSGDGCNRILKCPMIARVSSSWEELNVSFIFSRD